MSHFKIANLVPPYLSIIILSAIFAFITSCEKTDYDLLDPDSAGVWTHLTKEDGLPGNQVMDIKLDSEGILWFAFSNSGVASYIDGTITNYNSSNSSIINDFSTALGPMAEGAMLIGTADGISLRTADDQWASYKDPDVSSMYINTIKVTSDSILWVGTEGQCLYINEGSGFSHVLLTDYMNVNIIEEDSLHNVWIGTDNGLLKWDGSTLIVFTTSDGLPDNDVTAIFPDSKNRLWIGTNGGETVAWIDDSGIHNLQLMTVNGNVYVRDIIEDRRGDIWFATWFDGLMRYDGVLSYSYKIYNGFYENDVNTIGEDKDGNLWFGLYSKGLVKYTLPLE
jgi:ligand-binding sensor domain-containing protein